MTENTDDTDIEVAETATDEAVEIESTDPETGDGDAL